MQAHLTGGGSGGGGPGAGELPDVVTDRNKWFDYFDADQTGELNPEELTRALIKTYALGTDLQQVGWRETGRPDPCPAPPLATDRVARKAEEGRFLSLGMTAPSPTQPHPRAASADESMLRSRPPPERTPLRPK